MMLCVALITQLALTTPFGGVRPPTLISVRGAASCCIGRDDPLAATTVVIESMWELPCTQAGARRAIAARERHESTHAVLWGRDEWHEHVRPDRLLQIVLRWPRSQLARSLAPTLLVLAAWCCVVWAAGLRLTTTAIGYLATPLGLLLAFRVNSVIARLHEARTIWGGMIHTARNLASTLAATNANECPIATRALCCRYLVAFGWCAKATTRFDDDVRPLLSALLPAEDAGTVSCARKPALAVLHRLRCSTQPLSLSSHAARSVTDAISGLDRLHGSLERLLSMPLSPMYMRHTQRGLLLWLTMLPCGLLSAGCTSLHKLVLIVLSVAYLMLGIDEIGIQIEQPFEVLPLHLLAAILTKDVADRLLQDVHAPDTT